MCFFNRIITDLDAPKGAHLMGPSEEGSLNIVTLLLTGRATSYLHNGVIYVGDEDHYVCSPLYFLFILKTETFVKFQALPQFGILARAPVGLLILENDKKLLMTSQIPGSRLKTPAFPIWIASCCNHYGVLFNSNRELLRNYHAEKRFELHYYTCAGCYISMSVDNRSQDESMDSGVPCGSNSSTGINASSKKDDVVATPLERLIHTKWSEAKITMKGPVPVTLPY